MNKRYFEGFPKQREKSTEQQQKNKQTKENKHSKIRNERTQRINTYMQHMRFKGWMLSGMVGGRESPKKKQQIQKKEDLWETESVHGTNKGKL